MSGPEERRSADFIDFDDLTANFGRPIWRPLNEKIHSWRVATVDNKIVRVALYTITLSQTVRLVHMGKSIVDLASIIGRFSNSLRRFNGMPAPEDAIQAAAAPRAFAMSIDGASVNAATFYISGLRVDFLESANAPAADVYVAYPAEPSVAAEYRLVRAEGVERPFNR